MCNDFDFCQDCFASQAVRDAHFCGGHSFREVEARSAGFLRNIFGVESESQPEEETIVDNQLYEQDEQPIEVGEQVVVEEPEPEIQPIMEVEQQVFDIPHPLNPIQPIIEQPVVQPIIEQLSAFQVELGMLRDMGFSDENRNIQLLNKYNCDLQRVI